MPECRPLAPRDHEGMSNRMKYVLAGAAVALLAWLILPHWLAAIILVAIVAAPVVGYFALDESQRRRLSRLRSRGQLRR
jgi:Flp pilus assembly protein TadB